MPFLQALEATFVVLFLAVMVTQFFMPIFQGRPVFWAFTKEGRRLNALHNELDRLRREAEKRGLLHKIEEANRVLDEDSRQRLQRAEEELLRVDDRTDDRDQVARSPHHVLAEDEAVRKTRVAHKP